MNLSLYFILHQGRYQWQECINKCNYQKGMVLIHYSIEPRYMLCLSQSRTWIFNVLLKDLSYEVILFVLLILVEINVREYRRGNQKRTIREAFNTDHTRRRKTKQKHNTICVGHHYWQANTNNVNKTWALPQTTVGKDALNIVLIQKS